MSFSSSANSSLVPILPKYPTKDTESAGYVETPVLNYISVPSGSNTDAFFPNINLPYGVWLLTGVLRFDATAGNITKAVAYCRLNGVTNQGQMEMVGAAPYLVMPISFVVSSGLAGTEDQISLLINATTSGGANWSLDNGVSSLLRLVRLA